MTRTRITISYNRGTGSEVEEVLQRCGMGLRERNEVARELLLIGGAFLEAGGIAGRGRDGKWILAFPGIGTLPPNAAGGPPLSGSVMQPSTGGHVDASDATVSKEAAIAVTTPAAASASPPVERVTVHEVESTDTLKKSDGRADLGAVARSHVSQDAAFGESYDAYDTLMEQATSGILMPG